MESDFKQLRKSVFERVVSMVDDYNDAEDITQNVMIKIWKDDSFDNSRGKEKEWLTEVTINTVKDYWRKENREPSVYRFSELLEDSNFEIVDDETPEDVAEKNHIKSRIYRTLLDLPKEQKTCLYLNIEGYNNSEIQAITGKKHDTVSHLLKTARENLKNIIMKNEKIYPKCSAIIYSDEDNSTIKENKINDNADFGGEYDYEDDYSSMLERELKRRFFKKNRWD